MTADLSDGELLQLGVQVLTQEAAALTAISCRLGQAFVACARLVVDTPGRVIVTGMGKSGAIARKAAATLASTGTPSAYLHPGEGVHGDLGMVTSADTVLALSYSGETDELTALLPTVKHIGARLIAVTGNRDSTLAAAADQILDVSVEREACPLNLAPTTSTTAMLGMMDALAVAVMQLRRFTREDFALFHPAGSLGRRLLLRVRDVMRVGGRMALCSPSDTVRDALFSITRAESGSAFAVDADGRFVGLLSDGDIRRLLISDPEGLTRPLSTVLNRTPRTIEPDRLAMEGLQRMEEHPPCGELPVLDGNGAPVGVLNLKDLVRAGIL